MDILTGILIALASSIFTLSGREIVNKWKRRLSPYEKWILRTAHGDQGDIKVFSTDQTGKFVTVGPSALNQGAAEKAAGLEALEKLIEKGYVRHEGGVLYSLSGSGFNMAEKLGSEIELPK